MSEGRSRRTFLFRDIPTIVLTAAATEFYEGFVPSRYGLQQFFPNSPVELLKRYQDTQRKVEEKEQEVSKFSKELQDLRAQYSQLESANKQVLTQIAEAEVAYKQASGELERFRKNGTDSLTLIRKLFSDNKEKLGSGAEYGLRSVDVIEHQASRISSLQSRLEELGKYARIPINYNTDFSQGLDHWAVIHALTELGYPEGLPDTKWGHEIVREEYGEYG